MKRKRWDKAAPIVTTIKNYVTNNYNIDKKGIKKRMKGGVI